VIRSRSVLRLEGTWLVRAPRQAVYEIITDFARLPVYFPAVARSAHVVRLDGRCFVVEAQTKAFLGSKTYRVRMEGELRPPEGFVSTNTSGIGVEQESFMMEEVREGTRIRYVNVVDVRSPWFRLFGSVLLRHVALWYWKHAVIDRIEGVVAAARCGDR
jgi:carbon monoxide dehydrogenase subunit G